MNDRFNYRLSESKKKDIAENLIDILTIDAKITEATRGFISNWLCTGPDEKRKAFFDVWDIVLKNYMPTERPILFRSCERIGRKNKIASFTGRLECARRFGNGQDYLLICDTKEELELVEQYYKKGEYIRTFYPLGKVLVKARDKGGCGFSERTWSFIGEDEYIMRINVGNINKLKWVTM
ncbi:hypothetical protein [Flavobacterium sp. AG291]|uniref:hypothetical protein n=1 Tax=Flavobacterium sp. AG291 TaxID=2184000 RepID=UPI000E2DDCA8|nr:hypothetical protein [Flavobacterium sp. AG291]RDI11267.1 hypothetical protein DEU42_106201 [Flavobacterium sp. AG291]